jgi:lipoprotein Spr
MHYFLFYIRLFLFAGLLSLHGCKHKEKQAIAAKGPVKKQQPVSKSSKVYTSELQKKLGISAKQVKENKLYSFIEEWYGVPYKYGGCQKNGVDCSCFTNLLYEKVYGKKIARSTTEIYSSCDKISIEDATTGDLIFFKIGGNTISHVGIFIKNKLFVHSSTSKGVIINSIDEAYYKKYYFCAGKMKNV